MHAFQPDVFVWCTFGGCLLKLTAFLALWPFLLMLKYIVFIVTSAIILPVILIIILIIFILIIIL